MNRSSSSASPQDPAPGRSPVTADDVALAVRLAAAALRTAPADGWDRPAGSLEWTCWQTAEHLADDLFSYAAQIGPGTPPLTKEVPFVWRAAHPAGARPMSSTRTGRTDRAGCFRCLRRAARCWSRWCAPLRRRCARTTSSGSPIPRASARWASWRRWCTPTTSPRGSVFPWHPPAGVCARVLAPALPRRTDGHRTLADPAVGDRPRRAPRPSPGHRVALAGSAARLTAGAADRAGRHDRAAGHPPRQRRRPAQPGSRPALPGSSSPASRSPRSASRPGRSAIVKPSCSGAPAAATSSQVRGVETVGSSRARTV